MDTHSSPGHACSNYKDDEEEFEMTGETMLFLLFLILSLIKLLLFPFMQTEDKTQLNFFLKRNHFISQAINNKKSSKTFGPKELNLKGQSYETSETLGSNNML